MCSIPPPAVQPADVEYELLQASVADQSKSLAGGAHGHERSLRFAMKKDRIDDVHVLEGCLFCLKCRGEKGSIRKIAIGMYIYSRLWPSCSIP
jgi:hypothetical protein